MWFLVPLACAPSEDDGADAIGGEDSAVPAEDDVPLVPTWPVEEAFATAQGALDAGLPDPLTVRDLYFGLIDTGGDALCPGSYQLVGSTPEGCVSESGYLYAGLSTWSDVTTESGHQWSLAGDFEIATPDGRSFFMGGRAQYVAGPDFVQGHLEGTLIFEGGDAWFDPGVSAVFTVKSFSRTGDAEVWGGFTASGVSFYFYDVYWHAETDAQPNGVVTVRDPGGAWYTLTMADGTGCGAVVWDTAEVGAACLDLAAPLTAFVARVEGSP